MIILTAKKSFLLFVLAALSLAGIAPAALANPSGGVGFPAGEPSGEFRPARLLANGQAQAPDSAPLAVQRAIRAANDIAKSRYCWGGGHGSGPSNCYDCSGSLSHVLRAAGMLKTPKTSGQLMSWGRPGQGKWITVYANRGHTFAIIAGLRWDTAAVPGNGPRWSKKRVATRGFTARRWAGL